MSIEESFDESDLFKKNDYKWTDFLSEIILKKKSSQPHIYLEGLTIKRNLTIESISGMRRDINVIFSNCTFNGILKSSPNNRINLEFKNNCTFDAAVTIILNQQSKSVLFENCTFNSSFEMLIRDYIRFAHKMTNCIFNGIANFGEGKYVNHLTLDDSIFNHSLPNLRYCTLEKELNLHTIGINETEIVKKFLKDTKEKKENWIPDLARDLKLKAANLNDHLREMDFFAIESQTRAITHGGWSKFISSAYKSLSNYGRSIGRPVVIWFIILLLTIVINSGIALSNKKSKENYFDDVLVISLKNSLPLTLGFNKETVKQAYKVVFQADDPPICYQLFRLILVGFNLFLWFIFFLAIRNRFKMG